MCAISWLELLRKQVHHLHVLFQLDVDDDETLKDDGVTNLGL